MKVIKEVDKMKIPEHFQSLNLTNPQDTANQKLLIIEDDEQIRETLILSFQIYWPECKLEFATLGRDGIKAARKGVFNTILLDLILPDISGLEVLSEIRSFSNVPVIVLTADHTPENYQTAKMLGANAYIWKPYKQKDLFSAIKQNINLRLALN
jgi:DNA-binding response OmpR family regulator